MYEDSDMTAQSLCRDMVIGTPGAAANLDKLVKSGMVWKRGDPVLEYASTDNWVIRRPFEKHS